MPAEEVMKKSSSIFKFISYGSLTFCFAFLTVLPFLSCSKKTEKNRKNEVIIYTYDSFLGDWGPGDKIESLFEEKTGLDLTFVNCGDGIQLLDRAIIEKDNVKADIILGLDNNLIEKIDKSEIFVPYIPENAEKIIPETLINQLTGKTKWLLTPYDYSHFAMIFDTESSLPCPESLEDLTNPVYKKKIILMDPRTSTPGYGFVAWTAAVYGKNVLEYWERLKPNILTMAPDWSSGYGLFKKGEAPLVISYTTSPATHIEYDNTDQYIAAVFEQGHTIQVEGAGILKNAPNLEGAQLFMDFLITEEVQDILPLTQWMIPANKNVKLPECYKKACPVPEKTLRVSEQQTDEAVSQIMKIFN